MGWGFGRGEGYGVVVGFWEGGLGLFLLWELFCYFCSLVGGVVLLDVVVCGYLVGCGYLVVGLGGDYWWGV